MNFCKKILWATTLSLSTGMASATPEPPEDTATAAVDTSTERRNGITTFRERISLRFLCNYNFVAIWNSAYGKEALISNRPVDIGIGFGYDDLFSLFGTSWDFSWDLKFSLPFTYSDDKARSIAFELGLDFFPNDWWLEAYISSNRGFNAKSEDHWEYVDLQVIDIYLSTLWMATAYGKFSPRSAYFLDRRQATSAGSMIIGGRLQRNIVDDMDNILAYYDERRDITCLWTDLGYTYSWVFDNGFFVNLWGIMGIAAGNASGSQGYAFLPEIDGKMAVGYLGEKWSWNTVLKTNYSTILYSSRREQKVANAFEILVVRRF